MIFRLLSALLLIALASLGASGESQLCTVAQLKEHLAKEHSVRQSFTLTGLVTYATPKKRSIVLRDGATMLPAFCPHSPDCWDFIDARVEIAGLVQRGISSERLENLNGSLEFAPAPNGGTKAIVRIVILTSYGTSREMSDAIANGASGTLMKDVATAELTRVIRAEAADIARRKRLLTSRSA